MTELNGKIIEGNFTSGIYKPNSVYRYTIHVPEECNENYSAALSLHHDGLNRNEALAVYELAKEGKAPFTVSIGVFPATLYPTLEGGEARFMRSNDYDLFDESYPYFVTRELIPHLIEIHSLSVSPSADMHTVSGGSSGAISAFNVAWHCPDFFHRIYMSSPSFLSMGGGRAPIELMRKYEPKPFRIYYEYSEHEPNDYFGSSYCAAIDAKMALEFSGYPILSKYFENEGHCSRYRCTETLKEGYEFLWKEDKVSVPEFNKRLASLIDKDSSWEATDLFPEKEKCGYSFDQSGIIKGEKTLADGFSHISSLAVSSDKWRLYIADKDRSALYAMSIERNGELSSLSTLAILHTKTVSKIHGALDIVTDEQDRIYALTELGIQCVRSFGIVDFILSLPEGSSFDEIAIGDNNGVSYLYVKNDTKIYRKKIKNSAAKNTPTKPHHTEYYII